MYESSTQMATSMQDFYMTLYYGLGIAELGISAAIFVWGLIVATVAVVITGVLSFGRWLTEAIPTYNLAKKLGYKQAYLAWCPFFGSYFRTFVLAAMVENKPFQVFDKIKIQSRALAFWAYIALVFFGNTIITVAIGILNLVPGLGQILGAMTTVLYLLPPVAAGIIEYVFLKDVADLFKADEKSNNTAAIVVTVLDALATLGFARAIYLCTLMKCDPLPQADCDAQ